MSIYRDSSGSAWHDETIDIPNGGWGSSPGDWNGAKTATQSQEIPNRVMLVLPISRDVVDGPRGLVFLPGWYGMVLGA